MNIYILYNIHMCMYRFSFFGDPFSKSSRQVVVRGFRCAWSWLKQQSHDKTRGEGLHPTSAAYFKTVGQGPEMYVSGPDMVSKENHP